MFPLALPTVTLTLLSWSSTNMPNVVLADVGYLIGVLHVGTCPRYTKAVCSILQLLSNTHVDILSVYVVLALSSMLSAYIVPVGPPFTDIYIACQRVLPPVSGTRTTAFAIGARFEAVQAMTYLSTRPN